LLMSSFLAMRLCAAYSRLSDRAQAKTKKWRC
jgi:hypothetical protein